MKARPRPVLAPILALIAALGSLGASGPEVVKVRVPSGRVASWFPSGTELRVVPIDRFDELARAAGERPPAPRPARVLRASHSARWEAGTLVGRSTWEFERPSGPSAGPIVLDPWSPAIVDGAGDGPGRLRATREGRLAILADPSGPSRVEVDWRLSARPGSEGLAFALAVPETAISALTLDLPAGLVPEAEAGVRIGPEPGPAEGRSTWRFDAARGRVSLRLRAASPEGRPDGSPGLWLDGPTRVDLDASPANWRADWTLDDPPGAPRTLTIALDPGLDLVDVEGPRVASFRLDAGGPGPGARVAIRLGEGDPGPSPLTLRGIVRPPAEGTWTVPSARPLDATWTGGRTTVRLDPSRVLQGCVERSGRRVPAIADDPTGPSVLAFEPAGMPGPVADLSFRKPTPEVTFDVRGWLRVDDDAPRIVVALAWTAERGRVLARAVDLPPGWSPDLATAAGGEPVAFHEDLLSNGGTRVAFAPSATGPDSGRSTVILAATARGVGGSGPLDLPRVRPSPGPRVVDEVWLATVAEGWTFRPTLARGLAWVDPPSASTAAGPSPAEVPWPGLDLGGALAWRWLADDAEGRADRSPAPAEPRADVRLGATIARGRLRLDWTLIVDAPRGDLRSIPIRLDGPPAGPIRWRGRGAGGPAVEVEVEPVDDDRRASLGLPPGGSAFELTLTGPARGRVELRGRAERDWSGAGSIPLLTLPARFRARGLVGLDVEAAARARVDARGLTPIDLPRDRAEAPSGPPRIETRRASTFAYGPDGGRLVVETDRPPGRPGVGPIREAFLASQAFPGSGVRHRLTLSIANAEAGPVDFRLPAGCVLEKLRRDGQPVAPAPIPPEGEGRIRVELPGPTAGRSGSTITLDYRTPDDPRLGPLEARRMVPEVSLACLSFAWEVSAPSPWTLGDVGPGLVATDPAPRRSPAARILGFELPGWSRVARDRGEGGSADPAALADLDPLAAGLPDGEATLGDWLLKLDSGRRPIVVDRLALRSAGYGPASRIARGPAGPDPVGPTMAVLRPMGLTARAVGGAVLVTTRDEAPGGLDEAEATAPRLAEAASTGSDRSDRFQSAARWRGEDTPRAPAAGDSPERPTTPAPSTTWRLVAPGWPDAGASIALVDGRAARLRGWLVALAVLVAGALARGRRPRDRAAAFLLLGAGAAAWVALTWPEPPPTATGLVRGLLAVLASWVGGSIRPPSSSSASASPRIGFGDRSTSIRAPGTAPGAFVLALALALGATASTAEAPGDGPILALCPFDGPVDPGARPDRVVLRLDDFERLERLAAPPAIPEGPGPTLASARHRVHLDGAGPAEAESSYEVDWPGEGATTWALPVGTARDLSAEVDGRATPLAISADGAWATVAVEGPGRHPIRFRRLVTPSATGPGGGRVRLPINPAAFAELAVERGDGPLRVEVANAAGPSEDRDGEVVARIGPAEALDVRWSSGDRPPTPGLRGAVEANVLWDAGPVGDLFRARLTHSDPEGASTIRLAVEPGLLVRRFSIPGAVSARFEGPAGRPEWVVQVDPPLPRDRPIEVDFWRPAPPGSAVRRWPRVEAPGASRFSGTIGFRRPDDWSGRLEPPEGAEALTDLGFLRAWGPLDDPRRTLAGSIRFASTPTLEVATAPVPLQRTVRARVQADLGPGRMDVAIDATLVDRSGRSFELGVGLPPEFRVARVRAGGLVDWRRVGREGLRLQFDGPEPPPSGREIRIEGHLPVEADRPTAEARSYQARVPWPSWSDVEPTPGVLVISGPARFPAEPGEGVVSIANAGASPAPRSTFRVDRPAGLPPVSWAAPAPRIGVAVLSELRIDPKAATWTAVVRSEVSGGPAESLHWDLPADWAASATLEVDGRPVRPTAEAPAGGGTTRWTIQPDSPIWGRSRAVLRSTRPLRPGAPFPFPEVAPLGTPGRGSVASYDLAIANLSGRPLEVAGTPGLQPIDSGRVRVDESPSPPGSIDRAYHVTGEKWSLRLKVGREGEGEGQGEPAPDDARSRVALAVLACGVADSGATWGRARYDLQPRPGPFLAVRLPESAEIPWASVDGAVGPALREGPGRWLVPLGDRGPRRVVLAWYSPGDRGPSRPGEAAGLPAPWLEQAGVPTLVTASTPPGLDLVARPGGAERLDPARWLAEDADRLAGRAIAALGDLDRSSRRDRGPILDDLIGIELDARALDRVADPDSPAVAPASNQIRSARASVVEEVEVAGLDELVQEARARVGVEPAFEDGPSEPEADPADLVRPRQIGETRHFRANSGRSLAIGLARTTGAGSPEVRPGERLAIGAVGALLALAAAGLISRLR